MAKIFWNEVSAIILSGLFFTALRIYFNLPKEIALFIASCLMIIISYFIYLFVATALKDAECKNFIFVGAYVMAGLTLFLSGLNIGIPERGLLHSLIVVMISFLTVYLSYRERKISGNGARILLTLFLQFVIILLLSSFTILLIGIIGIAIMAIIAFFPFDSRDIDYHLPNHNGFPG